MLAGVDGWHCGGFIARGINVGAQFTGIGITILIALVSGLCGGANILFSVEIKSIIRIPWKYWMEVKSDEVLFIGNPESYDTHEKIRNQKL